MKTEHISQSHHTPYRYIEMAIVFLLRIDFRSTCNAHRHDSTTIQRAHLGANHVPLPELLFRQPREPLMWRAEQPNSFDKTVAADTPACKNLRSSSSSASRPVACRMSA